MWRRSWIPIALIAATTALCTFAFRGLTIDDAFISFRFAQHARAGLGLVWNPGEGPVEGMTSLLWTGLLVPFALHEQTTYAWARALGVLANLATLALWIRLVLRWFPPRRAAVALGALCACCPLFAFHALNGLDTALATLCASALVAAAIGLCERYELGALGDARFARAASMFGALWVVAGATRPELVSYGACLATLAAWELDGVRRRVLLRRLGFSFLVPGAILFALRFIYFGHLLPLPFYAKRAGGIVSAVGVKYVALTFLGLLGCASVLALLGRARRFGSLLPDASARLLLWPALGACAAYVAFGPAMGFVYRYPAPFVLPIVGAASATVAHVLDRRDAGAWVKRIAYGLGALGVLQLSSASVPAWHFATVNSHATREFHQRFGEALARLPERGRLAAFNDVGGPAFFSGWPTVEGAGLVTPSVCLDGVSNRALVESFAPDVITVRADERRIEAASREFPGYRLLRAVPWLVFAGDGPRHYQCVLARDGYAHAVQLNEALQDLGVPERDSPWYFALYRRLRAAFV